MLNLKTYPIRSPEVVWRIIDANESTRKEVVIVIPSQNQVKLLNEVGAKIWSLIDGSLSVSDIAVEISKEFEVDLEESRNDTLDFVEELVDKGMVRIIP